MKDFKNYVQAFTEDELRELMRAAEDELEERQERKHEEAQEQWEKIYDAIGDLAAIFPNLEVFYVNGAYRMTTLQELWDGLQADLDFDD